MAGLADPGHGQGGVGVDRLDAPPVRSPGGRRRAGRRAGVGVVCAQDLRLDRPLPYAYRDSADEFLAEKAAGGLDLDGLAQLAEQIYSQLAPPDRDQDDDARFKDRFFRLTRLFQGHGKADGDLTPECLAAVTEVLDTLGKKAGPEDDRSAGQRRHDALEEAMRLLLASGCLPDRAGQAAQVQLHLTLDELMDMPGASDAASAWLARHLGDAQPGDGGGDASLSDASAGHPDTSQPGGTISRAVTTLARLTRTRTTPVPASPAQAASPATGTPRPGPTWTS